MSQDQAGERELADEILSAHAAGLTLEAPRDHRMNAAAAYRVQRLVTQSRLDRGEVPAGWKLGYTSEVMRLQMGIAEPNMGPLTSAMILDDGAVISAGVTQPKVEPEVAAVIGANGSVAGWRAALEVVDSVWSGYDFDWALNTADGSSAAFVVLGPDIDEADLPDVNVSLSRNGEKHASGTAAAAMGHPRAAVAWLVEQLALRGMVLRAGDIVITGGLTSAVDLRCGDRVDAVFGRGTTVSVSRAADPQSR